VSIYEPHNAASAAVMRQLGFTLERETTHPAGGVPLHVTSLARTAWLGEDQAAAVRAVTLDGHAVACVVGPAGAGKSRTTGAAVDAPSVRRACTGLGGVGRCRRCAPG
jgi:hypothetical protein